MLQRRILYFLMIVLAVTKVSAQEESPFVTYDVPAQNLLKYNRFLINPTFSTVREDKSYINLLHRNQSVQFDDNNQNYFLSYSGRISDRTGLGLSLYTQRAGTVSNYGVLANYAYGVKLSEKSNFTFGANVSYYNSGFDLNRANTVDPNDPLLNGFQDSNLISFQPGFNISFGKFDVGIFAENLFDYNLKTSESITSFTDKTFSGHLQYTHQFENASGILEDGRLIPLARARKVGQGEVVLGGSLILDLPKLGWLQGGYDSFYGAAAGVGFNLNRRISIGYTMEKGLSNNFDNFGLTHEISFAYAFTPTLTEDRVMLEDGQDELVLDEEFSEDGLTPNEEVAELKRKLAENDAILAELMFRQDSVESNRQRDLERRFKMVMQMVRNETQGARPDLEKKAKELYLGEDSQTSMANNSSSNNGIIPNGIKPKTKAQTIDVRNGNLPNTVMQDQTKVSNDAKVAENSQEPRRTSIKSRKFSNLEGVKDGYYVVANVYKGGHYLNKFIEDLGHQGLEADYIDNPHNGLKYVYLKRYDTWQEAMEANKSKLGGAYSGDLWVMNVDNRYSNDAYVDNVNKLKEKSTKYGIDVLQKNVVVKDNVAETGSASKPYNIDGIGTDYYLIANVFANPTNANRFVKLLNSYGLSAAYFINPKNKLRYVYLKKHDSWNSALISYYTKLNDSYDDKMWIMRVTPNLIT